MVVLEVGVARHVLFLDIADAPDARLSDQIARCGFDVARADDAGTAVERLAERTFDLMVVHADGTDELDVALTALGGVPLAIVLAQPSAEATVRWLEAGADTVLASPVSRRELAARLEALVRGSAAYHERGGRYRPAIAAAT